jgi:hypothetical protein
MTFTPKLTGAPYLLTVRFGMASRRLISASLRPSARSSQIASLTTSVR